LREQIAPWQITEKDDPVVALNTPRPDFNGAMLQFLIGLLQTAFIPSSEEEWLYRLENPPSPEDLKESFIKYVPVFNLNSGTGAFMQDFENVGGKFWPIEKMLMESPGENTEKFNKDHFFKRNQFEKICESCAAMALFSFQQNTQGFGSGHRVNLRGKGYLTTLVVIDENFESDFERKLWANIWLNVLEQDWFYRDGCSEGNKEISDIFPWMNKTRISTAIKVDKKTVYIEGGVGTYPESVNRLQLFWSMPCRIKLQIQNNDCKCSLCNKSTKSVVNGFNIQKYGVDYLGDWRHPLTPHFLDKNGSGKTFKVPINGVHYQHWLGLSQKTDFQIPAIVAERYLIRANSYKEQFRLFCFGYAIDGENKARCWYETTYPLISVPDQIRLAFAGNVQILADASAEIAGYVRSCVKEAWFKRPGDAKGDVSYLAQNFYQHTQPLFFGAVNQLKTALVEGSEKGVLQNWHSILVNAALKQFDYWAANRGFVDGNPRRVVDARKKLLNLIHSKKIRAALMLPNQTKKSNKEKAA